MTGQAFWARRRALVTGGGGFLGSRVVTKLRERGADSIFVPRSADCDLRTRDGVDRALADGRAQLAILENGLRRTIAWYRTSVLRRSVRDTRLPAPR
jgi:nucleoside-diphosphate-sugar epimerase